MKTGAQRKDWPVKKLLLLSLLFGQFALAQTTTTITGTIRDLSGALVTSGQITFTLRPSTDVTMSGLARFTTQTITCAINSSGQVVGGSGSGACTITMNTALQPPGSGYLVTFLPYNVKTATIFMYALTSSLDITTVVSTQAQLPSLGGVVDTFTTQAIGGNKTFTGTTSFSGPVSGMNIVNAGVFSNTQENNTFTVALGGINPATWYVQTPNFATDAIAGGALIPSTATVHQINALAGYIFNNCDSLTGSVCNGVGVYTQAIAGVNASWVWGGNIAMADSPGTTLTGAIGTEFDNSLYGSPISFTALQINGIGTGTMPAGFPVNSTTLAGDAVMDIWAPLLALGGSEYQWKLGINFRRGSVNGTAMQVDGLCTVGTCNSAPITFTGYDSSNNPHTAAIYSDNYGNLNFDGAVALPPVALASLPTNVPAGGLAFCTNCKNVVDDTATAGAACITGGHGAVAKRENSRWDCN
jgi:hypothetical protein